MQYSKGLESLSFVVIPVTSLEYPNSAFYLCCLLLFVGGGEGGAGVKVKEVDFSGEREGNTLIGGYQTPAVLWFVEEEIVVSGKKELLISK